MTVQYPMLLALFQLVLTGSALGAILTFRSNKEKLREEREARKEDARRLEFTSLQAEVGRLRSDLESRDVQARDNFEEIRELRNHVLILTGETHKLEARISHLSAAVQVLVRQLESHNITPLVDPVLLLATVESDLD